MDEESEVIKNNQILCYHVLVLYSFSLVPTTVSLRLFDIGAVCIPQALDSNQFSSCLVASTIP